MKNGTILCVIVIGFIMKDFIVSGDEKLYMEDKRVKVVQVPEGWVPDWAKKAVWYQIFPERFRNGDSSNDPRVEDIKGSWPHDYTSPWQIHPWTSDWYELQPWEKKNGKDIWFNIQRRRYGGDIQGIIDKLDYLEELGVNALYLNPVFESPSLHKYDGARYNHVDPNFGPDPDGDRRLIAAETPDDPSTWVWTSADKLLLKLIRKLHSRGMKIILDGVFNHVGINNPFFQDVVKKQKDSRYKDWFVIESWDNPGTGEQFKYSGWFGVKELPEWREDENGIAQGPKKYIFDITRRWMDPDGDGDPSDGIDGWRLDVAFCVSHRFWKDWSKHVKSINPEAYLTAEVIDTVKANKPYLEGDEFTAVMNYNFSFACYEYFIEKNSMSTTIFESLLDEIRSLYDPSIAYAMQNLLDSHDTARTGTHIVNHDKVSFRAWPRYCEKSRVQNGVYDPRKPNEEELNILKLLVIFQMTYIGSPMIYYGDEAGMWGGNDPCCRKPMVWEDLNYSDEAYLPDGTKKKNSDKVSFNRDIFEHYKKLIKIRTSQEALQIGDFKTLLADDENQIYAFSRSYNKEYIVVILNNGVSSTMSKVKLEKPGKYIDLLNGKCEFDAGIDGVVSAEITSKWVRILRLER